MKNLTFVERKFLEDSLVDLELILLIDYRIKLATLSKLEESIMAIGESYYNCISDGSILSDPIKAKQKFIKDSVASVVKVLRNKYGIYIPNENGLQAAVLKIAERYYNAIGKLRREMDKFD